MRSTLKAPSDFTPSVLPIAQGRRAPGPRYPGKGLVGAGLIVGAALLSSCDDDHRYGGCSDCAPYQPYQVSYGVVAGDFNGNGHTSVVATSTVIYQAALNPGNLETYLSTGPGTFAAPTVTKAGDNPLYLTSADLNGDNLPDVVSASQDDGTVTVFFNNAHSAGTFSAPLVLKSPGASQAAIGDVNGDGLPDIVSADYNVTLFLQTGPGTFASGVSLYSGGANWVAVGDLNGDGAADIALTDADGVKVLMHTGAAGSTTFAAPVSVFTASVSGENLIAIADVNGDGLDDLLITDPDAADGTPSVYVLLQSAAAHGQFLSAVRYPLGMSDFPRSIAVADLNGDGRLDIVVGTKSGVAVLLQSATTAGQFAAAVDYSAPEANEIAVADVNGDGLADLVVPVGASTTMSGGVAMSTPGVLLQVGSARGTFSALQNLP